MPTLALDLTRAPADAVEFFDAKGHRLTWSWLDMLRQDHDLAFTVAKATTEEVLGAIRTQVAKAIGQGMTFAEFKRTLKPQLQDLGWWGRQELLDGDTGEVTTVQLGSDRRLRTIYQTNIQTAYMAARYKRMVGNATDRPYWRYVAIMDGRTRPKHRELNGRVFRWDDPIWQIIFPPNGFGCRCRVVAMTEAEFQAQGIELGHSEGMRVTKTVTMPDGRQVKVSGLKGALPGGGDFFPDVGWDHNPGDHLAAKARLESVLEEKTAMAKRAAKAARAKVEGSQPEPAKPADPTPFDTSTEAGKWHQPAWEGAPKWLRDVVLDQQQVNVVSVRPTACATAGSTIDRDGLQLGSATDQSTWRHEMGHILDYRLGTGGQYASSGDEMSKAIDAWGDELHQAWQYKSTQASNYTDASRAMHKDPGRVLPDAVPPLGMQVSDFVDLLRNSTTTVVSADPTHWSPKQRSTIGAMLHAIKVKDVERLFSLCIPDMSPDQWQVDGALVALSDLVGAASNNRVCNYASGYYGHSAAYYTQNGAGRYTEVFANLTALAGHKNPAWWSLIRHLAPDLAGIYEQLITSN